MKKPDQTTLSDFLKLGEAAFSVLLGAREEIKSQLGDKRDVIVSKLDLVTRDEFDAAFAMIKKARKIQDEMDERLTALEVALKKKSTLSSPEKRPAKKQNRPKV